MALIDKSIEQQAYMMSTIDYFWLLGWGFMALIAVIWFARPPFSRAGGPGRAEYESDRKVPLPVTPSLRAFINGQEVDVNRANAALQHRSGMPVQIRSGSRQMF